MNCYLTVDRSGLEKVHSVKPKREGLLWHSENYILLEKGTIEDILGDPINWRYSPVEIPAEKVRFEK